MFIKTLAGLANSKLKITIIIILGVLLTLISSIPGTGNYDIDQWLPYIYAVTDATGLVIVAFGLSLFLQHYDLQHGRNSLDYEEKLAHLYLPIVYPILILISLGTSFLPAKTETPNTVTKIEPGITYVTYSPKCNFCKEAEPARKKAVWIYNATHRQKVQTINLDKDTKLAKQIKKHLTHKGMFISQYSTKTGRQVTATQIYTVGIKEKGKLKPVKPNDKKTYESLVTFINNNK